MLPEPSNRLGCWPVRWIAPSPPETDFKSNAPHSDAPGHREAERLKKLGERRLGDTLVSSPTPGPVLMEQDSQEGAGVQERLCLLTSVHMCSHLFMSAHVCSRLLACFTCAHVCSCLFTYAHVCSHVFTSVHVYLRLLTSVHVCSRLSRVLTSVHMCSYLFMCVHICSCLLTSALSHQASF